MAENILITICARAGSKRLPNKNILPLHGKPLFEWTVEQANKFKPKSIIISTDSANILNTIHSGKWSYVEDLPRPLELCQDDTPKLDVIRHALNIMESIWAIKYDTIIDLDVTNPLRTVEHIEEAYQTFINGKYDSLSSVVEARKNPYYSMLEIVDGKVEYSKRIYGTLEKILCSQQAPKVYEQNANIYIYSRHYFLDKRNKDDIGYNTGIYIMPAWTFCDINTQLDFEIVEFLMDKYLLKKEKYAY